MVDLQYADDITWVATNSKDSISHVKERIPSKLSVRNLIINDSTTEEYKISRGPDNNWENCKHLGSLLDTDADIKQRKS